MGEKREPWHRWLGRRLDWVVASAVGTLAVVLAVRQFAYYGEPVQSLMTLFMAALPIACLVARPTLVTMIGLIMVGFPCFISASVCCDVSSSAATGGLLHATEDYLLTIPLYGFLRAVHLSITKR